MNYFFIEPKLYTFFLFLKKKFITLKKKIHELFFLGFNFALY